MRCICYGICLKPIEDSIFTSKLSNYYVITLEIVWSLICSQNSYLVDTLHMNTTWVLPFVHVFIMANIRI